MVTWLADKVLPGLITGAIMSAGTWLSHRKLKRHITAAAGKKQDGTGR